MRHLPCLLGIASLCAPAWSMAQQNDVPQAVALQAVQPRSIPSAAPTLAEPPPSEVEPEPSEYEPPPAPLKLPVAPLSPKPVTKYRWPLWRILTGSALVVGGGVMFGFGMSAFAFDGVCVPTPPPGVECRRYYDTKSDAIALTTSGVLTAVGGLLLISIPSRTRPPKSTASLLLPSVNLSLSRTTD